MDSNHRRRSQLSYSQPHLSTLVSALAKFKEQSFVFCGAKIMPFFLSAKFDTFFL